MKYLKGYIIVVSVFGSAVILVLLLYLIPKINTVTEVKNYESNNLLQRLHRLEPEKPEDIQDRLRSEDHLPSVIEPISEVINNGREIALNFIYHNPDWERLAYKSYWHSTVSGGRWSRVPTRMSYALHRIFTSYCTASVFYDFVHDLGIDEESKSFHIKTDGPFDKIIIVVMQSNVKKILTQKNQVVLITEPKGTGLQVLSIDLADIHPAKPKERIVFQLVTPDRYEIDNSVIEYIGKQDR
ncbi:hypothetical protein [Candidatus Formimonas warabiya]|uniref:hypothetical protein n=1 Tax=Formimonas warabiya TaxID=1761012 RepID=UPI0011D0CD14|nr:hypothetical protein [Candidatus Formimonas warabiya]